MSRITKDDGAQTECEECVELGVYLITLDDDFWFVRLCENHFKEFREKIIAAAPGT